MKKTVILSSNDNPDYLLYYSYVAWAWNQLGWDTLLFYLGKNSTLMEQYKTFKTGFDATRNLIIPLAKIAGYRDETVVQVSRLFGSLCFSDDRMLMTGDVDMIPLSSYWHPEPGKITTYGWDLTDKGHFPICYIAMNESIWRKVMGFPETFKTIDVEIKKYLDKYPKAKSDKFEEWWQVDQDIITELILKQSFVNRVDTYRGTDNGLAADRADRYNWPGTSNKENLIDAHMPRPFDLEAVKHVLQKSYNKLPEWMK